MFGSPNKLPPLSPTKGSSSIHEAFISKPIQNTSTQPNLSVTDWERATELPAQGEPTWLLLNTPHQTKQSVYIFGVLLFICRGHVDDKQSVCPKIESPGRHPSAVRVDWPDRIIRRRKEIKVWLYIYNRLRTGVDFGDHDQMMPPRLCGADIRGIQQDEKHQHRKTKPDFQGNTLFRVVLYLQLLFCFFSILQTLSLHPWFTFFFAFISLFISRHRKLLRSRR